MYVHHDIHTFIIYLTMYIFLIQSINTGGVPNKCNALGGNEVQVDMSAQHAVRCCTEDASVGWPFKCTGGITGVYGESNVPSCYSSSTFNEAVTICSAYSGGRLCSGTELLNKCTRGTGCGLNKALVWGCTEVSDTCASGAECCTGVCSGGVCDDPSVSPPAPTNPPTKDPTLAVSIHRILLCMSVYLSLSFFVLLYDV